MSMHLLSQQPEPQLQQEQGCQLSPEGAQLLPTHERPHQQQLKLLDDRRQLLGQLNGSKPAVVVLYTLLVLALVYVLGRRSHSGSRNSSEFPASISQGTGQSTRLGPPASSTGPGCTKDSSIDGSSSSSSSGTLSVPCAYGSLPGIWVSGAPAGSRWQLLGADCQLTNWLAVYEAAAHHSSSTENNDSITASLQDISTEDFSSSDSIDRLAQRYAAADASEADSSSDSSLQEEHEEHGGSLPRPPAARVLLLSDSVDRYIVQHVCEALGGTKHTHLMKSTPAAEAAEQQAAAAAATAADSAAGSRAPAAAATAEGAAPTLLNKTAYAFHTCESVAPVKLASSYFPGVHPTGPFHRFSAQGFRQRIDSARQMWAEYAGTGPGSEPQVVSVASLLWDVARLYMHERPRLEGLQELDRPLLEQWVTNFTAVVQYAQQAFPQTKLWVTHTTMPPHHDVATGVMTKPYLGRVYYIHQLNAAAAAAARRLGLQLVDYAAIGQRFVTGQQHLTDLIHPNAMVAVEVFNVMLNLALQEQRSQGQREQLDSLDEHDP